MGNFFAYLVAVLEFLAAVGYYCSADWKRGTLWLCYSVCAVLVTLL